MKVSPFGRRGVATLLCIGLALACGSQLGLCSSGLPKHAHPTAELRDPLASYNLIGDTRPIHDPSIIEAGSSYYMFTTDVGRAWTTSLAIRCSSDEQTWTRCGSIFGAGMPLWVRQAIPGVRELWAPDVTYWGGLYRVYYSGSTLGSQRSIIGMATNVTLDPSDPRYQWVDHGEVLGSVPGDDFNAIDPNILLDAKGRIFLSYGSYWSGIKQIEIDQATGMIKRHAVRQDLATRPGVPNNPIEGASIVRHGNYYYLFVSVDYCCNRDLSANGLPDVLYR